MTGPDVRAGMRQLDRDEHGAALVETALAVPIVLLVVLGVVMTGRVVQAQIAVQAVAREAARTVAVAPAAAAGLAAGETRARAVAAGHGLSPDQLNLAIDAGTFARGGTVRAEASYPVTLGDLPLIGAVDLTVASAHTQRIDTYRSRTAVTP